MESPERAHPSWVDAFISNSNHTNTPLLLRKWVALGCISAALQRKTWLKIQERQNFPNLFIVLVTPPGVGKTQAILLAQERLSSLTTPGMNFCPDDISSRQMFVKEMAKATKLYFPPDGGMPISMCNYTVLAGELSVLLKPKDFEFMKILTDFFDCKKVHMVKSLSRDSDRIENIFLTLIGGTTPRHIMSDFGPESLGKGLFSRTNFVYSEDAKPFSLLPTSHTISWDTIDSDLAQIHTLYGEFKYENNTVLHEINNWVHNRMPPIPSDGRISEYVSRRPQHLMKLCMIYSASRSNDMQITSTDYQNARETLLEVEQHLPRVFQYMGQSSASEAISQIHHWARHEYIIRGAPITDAELRRKMLSDISPRDIPSTIKEMLESGLFRVTTSTFGKTYTPI